MKTIIVLTAVLLSLLFPAKTTSQNLKILTLNVWSGLDYSGKVKMGEYETGKRREKRFQSLVSQIKQKNPDLIFLQEANPADDYASRLAELLGYDEIHQVCVAGIKIGSVGLPANLKEGNVILAKRNLSIEKYDAWKLSGSIGINGDAINIHTDEAIYALIGKILVNKIPVYVINAHLFSAVEDDSTVHNYLDSMYKNKTVSAEEYEDTKEKWNDDLNRQKKEVKRLLDEISNLPENSPVIVAGDFNSAYNSALMKKFQKEGKFINTFLNDSCDNQFTWDPERNENIKLTVKQRETKTTCEIYEKLDSYSNKTKRRIDHIFINKEFSKEDIILSEITLDSMIGNVQPSDHFGMLSEVSMANVLNKGKKETDFVERSNHSKLEPFPFVNYDADAGFGYGGKVFVLNKLKYNESFDLLLFNSTKGERLYKLVISIPDFELRQGKIYPAALDLSIDYDKWISNSFFGIGNNTKYEDKEVYTREPLEVKIILSRAFTKNVVSQFGLRYYTVKNYGFDLKGSLINLQPSQNQGKSNSMSMFLNLRFDNRNSYINPSKGSVAQLEYALAPGLKFTNTKYSSISLILQNYFIPFYPKTIFANRIILKSIWGNELPVQVLNSIGGNSTVRGISQDRYMDKISAVFNSELRFPLFWRFGGTAGFDAGNVWSSLDKATFRNTLFSFVGGLRFYMDTFVIRGDIGFSKEATGLYFNFGHIF